MKNKKFNIIIGMFIIVVFMVIPAQSELPEGHKQVICFDCHTNGRFIFGEEVEGDCGNCHVYTSKQSQEEQHNPNICKVCHGVSNSRAFHNIHINKTCDTCHGATGNAKPTSTMNECGGCHGGQIHIIHEKKLDDVCVSCHGSVPNAQPKQISAGSKAAEQIYAKIVDYKQYTLLELLKRLLNWK